MQAIQSKTVNSDQSETVNSDLVITTHNGNPPEWIALMLADAEANSPADFVVTLRDFLTGAFSPEDNKKLTELIVFILKAKSGEPAEKEKLLQKVFRHYGVRQINLLDKELNDQHVQMLCNAVKTDSLFLSNLVAWILLPAQKTDLSQHAGLIKLLGAIFKNTDLNIVCLWNKNLEDHHIQIVCAALAEALQTNKKIIGLEFPNNQIGPEGAKIITKLFKANPGLTVLRLNANRLGDEGAQVMADLVKPESPVAVLELGFNQINTAGIDAIEKARSGNTHLRELFLKQKY